MRRRPPFTVVAYICGHRARRDGAACVCYAMLTGRNPADSSFTAGLDRAEARWLARLADERVR